MHCIHIRILQQFLVIRAALLDAPVVPNFPEFVGVALADGIAGGVRMFLPKRDELGSEAEADDCDVQFACAHAN